MMSRKPRPLVEWSPHHSNYFVRGWNDLRLYETSAPVRRRHAKSSSGVGMFGVPGISDTGTNGETMVPSQVMGVVGDNTDEAYSSISRPMNMNFSRIHSPHSDRNHSHGGNYKVVHVNSDIRPTRCLDWHPGPANPFLIACGSNSGNVSLVNFRQEDSYIVHDFEPAHSRQCNDVAWNPLNENQLAVGLDKIRNANSVLVWDLNSNSAQQAGPGGVGGEKESGLNHSRGLKKEREQNLNRAFHKIRSVSNSINTSVKTSDLNSGKDVLVQPGKKSGKLAGKRGAKPHNVDGTGASVVKPWGEFANSEATVALSWVPDSATSLATGTNFKWLRIYDVRENMSKKQAAPLSVVAHHKGVYGVCFDKNTPSCLATFSEEPVIKIWDIRHLYQPVVEVISSSKNIIQIEWSPSRPDRKDVSIWDIRNTEAFQDNGNQDVEYGSEGTPVKSLESSHSHGHGTTNSKGMNAEPEDATIALESTKKSHSMDNIEKQSIIKLSKADRKRYPAKAPVSFAWKPAVTSYGHVTGLYEHPSSPRGPIQNLNAHGAMSDNVLFGHNQANQTVYSTHMIIVSSHGAIDEIKLQDPLPVALSPAGNVSFACNNVLYEGSITELDPSGLINTRARLGYSVDPLNNCTLLDDLILKCKKIESLFDRKYRNSNAGHQSYHSMFHKKKNFFFRDFDKMNKRGSENLSFSEKDLSRFGTMKFKSENEFYAASLGNEINLEDIRAQKRHIEVIADMWRWIYRASSLVNPDKAPGLGEAGVISMLSRRTAVQDETKLDTNLKPGFEIYRSRRRSTALQLCGWTDFGQNTNIPTRLEEYENRNELTRAATLAVFNCDLRRAVGILQRASTERRQLVKDLTAEGNKGRGKSFDKERNFGFKEKTLEEDTSKHIPKGSLHAIEEEADLLQLVAMGISGFPCIVSSSVNQGFQLWCESCINLQERLGKFPFLRAALAFLVAVYRRQIYSNPSARSKKEGNSSTGKSSEASANELSSAKSSVNGDSSMVSAKKSSNPDTSTASNGEELNLEKLATDALNDLASCVTNETSIYLADRIAFGCRFLPDEQLGWFIRDECTRAIEKGSLEGIVLTGLGRQGLQLLQSYVDLTGDVQTVALVSSHTLISQLPPADYLRIHNWVDSYRDLLNIWQLWHVRGKLDVKFAERERLRKAVADSSVGSSNAAAQSSSGGMNSSNIASNSKNNLNARNRNAGKSKGISLPANANGTGSSGPNTQSDFETQRHGNNNLSDGVEERKPSTQSLMSPMAGSPQISVVCKHCKHKFLSQDLAQILRANKSAGRGSSYKMNLPCCPNCKRPLPCCAVCSMPMHCLNPFAQKRGLSHKDRDRARHSPVPKFRSYGDSNPNNRDASGSQKTFRMVSPSTVPRSRSNREGRNSNAPDEAKMDFHVNPRGTGQPFGKWFSWCLRCRHGGHSACLTEWFSGHFRCPVAECQCQCTGNEGFR